jgi:hypothetical protein
MATIHPPPEQASPFDNAAAAALGVDASTPEGMLGIPARQPVSNLDKLKAAAAVNLPSPKVSTMPDTASTSSEPNNGGVLGAEFFMKRRQFLEDKRKERRECMEETRKVLENVTDTAGMSAAEIKAAKKRAEQLITSDNPEVATLMNLAQTGKDFHKEEVVAALEDPGLVAHMQFARDMYKSNLKELTQLRSEADIRDSAYKALGKFADHIKHVRGAVTEQDVAASEIEIMSRHIPQLCHGRPVLPHFENAFTVALNDPELLPAMQKVQNILEEKAGIFLAVTEFMEEHSKELARTRTEFIQIIDEFVKLCTSQNQTIAAQKKVLEMFNPILYKTELEQQRQYAEFNTSMSRARAQVKNKAPKQANPGTDVAASDSNAAPTATSDSNAAPTATSDSNAAPAAANAAPTATSDSNAAPAAASVAPPAEAKL